ncbi:MAG: hypothetical protein K8S87_01630, partial [Planctomycetes bacterium]|nr:hypothetical protein [Planctomycetota bacterium]
ETIFKLYSTIIMIRKKECENKINEIIFNISLEILIKSEIGSKIIPLFEFLDIEAILIINKDIETWNKILSNNAFAEISFIIINKIIEKYKSKYIIDKYMISIIKILDYIAGKHQNDTIYRISNYNLSEENNAINANRLFIKMTDEIKIKESQYINIISIKYLDLSKIFISVISNRKIIRSHIYAWKESSNTIYYKAQVNYAIHLCYKRRTDESVALLTKILDKIEKLVKNNNLITNTLPLHKLLIKMLDAYSLTGKFTETSAFICKVEKIVNYEKYFGKSLLSSERTDIYVAILEFYASFSMFLKAEESLLILLEKIIPYHKNAYPEHIFYFFQKIWKTVNNSFPHLLNNIIRVFDRVFADFATSNNQNNFVYYTYFRLYKDFTAYKNETNGELPAIYMNNETNAELNNNAQSGILALKMWFELADDVAIIKHIIIEDFVKHSLKQIQVTHSGAQGLIELAEFLISKLKHDKTSNYDEQIIMREISEIKKRLINLYSG